MSSRRLAHTWLAKVARDFEAAYLSADRRVLAAFRVWFGLVLLYDLARRVPEAARLYSGEGVVSGHFLRLHPQASPQFSLLFACSTPAQVKAAFALIAVVYLLYTLGLCTRVAQALALLACTSLNSRNLFFEDGGTCTTILLAAWTLFLPLGDRFSLDALVRDARAPQIAKRVRGRADRGKPVVSLAVLALLLQASVIYCFNAVHKSGWTWHHGEAVHLVLWQHRVNTPFALWFSKREPTWFSPAATWGVIRVERLLPVLLMFPMYRLYTRGAAFIAAIALHGGIALMMTLGPFSYAMIALLLICLPGEALDVALRAVPKKWWLASARLRNVVVLRLARQIGQKTRPASPACAWRTKLGVLREALLLTLLVASALQVRVDNPPARARRTLSQPALFHALLMYPRMQQYWGMFSPDAPTDDGTVVVDATTVSGKHIDPFTAAAPDFELGLRALTPHSAIFSDYLLALSLDDRHRYAGELARYLRAWPQGTTAGGRNDADRLVSFTAWWLSYRSPARGSTEPGTVQRRKLFHARL